MRVGSQQIGEGRDLRAKCLLGFVQTIQLGQGLTANKVQASQSLGLIGIDRVTGLTLDLIGDLEDLLETALF